MGFDVKVFLTDGLKGYLWAIPKVFHNAIHQICLFHHQQNISKFVKEHCSDEKEREIRKKEMNKHQLILFLVFYLFTQGEEGITPIERVVPEARRMPLYRLMNDPFHSLVLGMEGEVEKVKENRTLAENQQKEAA